MVAYSFQPPLLSVQEGEVAVPSIQDHVTRCQEILRSVHDALTHTTRRSHRLADCHHLPAPKYQPGQRVWLLTSDLPLQMESRKLAVRFVGQFEVDKIIDPTAVCLKLPATLLVHPTFHVSQLKPVSSSDLPLLYEGVSSQSLSSLSPAESL